MYSVGTLILVKRVIQIFANLVLSLSKSKLSASLWSADSSAHWNTLEIFTLYPRHINHAIRRWASWRMRQQKIVIIYQEPLLYYTAHLLASIIHESHHLLSSSLVHLCQ